MIQVELTFNQLMIFSPVEELAKTVSFTERFNVVTSSRVDGNDRGKSVIAKSLYHCMGPIAGLMTIGKELRKSTSSFSTLGAILIALRETTGCSRCSMPMAGCCGRFPIDMSSA